jgi:hypothetical protein
MAQVMGQAGPALDLARKMIAAQQQAGTNGAAPPAADGEPMVSR